MEISLIKATIDDASTIHEMQIRAFMPLLQKYKDYETSPANESVDRIIERLKQTFTDYYMINKDGVTVGAIRIVRLDNKMYRVSPIFVLPEHQGNGIAQKTFKIIENTYNDATKWELDTIMQEEANCYLYDKLGYRRIEKTKEINDNMTLVYYEKQVRNS